MTVSTTSTVVGPFVGTGSSATMVFSWKCPALSAIQVVKDGAVLLQNSNYSVSLNANQDTSPGGFVSINAAANTNGSQFFVLSDESFEQPVSLPSQSTWSPKVVEGALDRIALLCKQLLVTATRSLRVPIGETIGDMPNHANRANKYFAFDSNGNPTAIAGIGTKGDPGSPGGGYATRTAMAARAAPALLDDVFLTEKGREGKFVVDLASNWTAAIAADTRQGLFVLSTADATKVYRRNFPGRANVAWWGVAADGATDDSAAFQCAIATLKALAGNLINTYYIGGPGLFIPKGKYWLNTTTLDVTHTLRIEGEGNGQNGGIPTWLKWAANTTGIRFQRYNTSGDRIVGATHNGADGSILEGVYVESAFVGTDGNYHGIDTNCRITVRDCVAKGWQGNGLNIVANSGGTSGIEGNANGFAVERFMSYFNKNGIFISGDNTNAGYTLGCDIAFCRHSGILDQSFLGNAHISPQCSGCVEAPYKTTDANARTSFLNAYAESGQPPCEFAFGTIAFGGLLSEVGVTGGSWIRSELGVTTMDDAKITTAEIDTLAILTSLNVNFNSKLNINSGSNGGQQLQAGVNVNIGGVIGVGIKALDTGAGELPFGLAGSEIDFYTGGTLVAKADGSGINLPAGKVLRNNGQQVVGGRLPAVGADATDLASVIALANAIKARIKTTGGHGLVSD